MPLLHCEKCHHEWEGRKNSKCKWCNNNSYILEEKTPLEESFFGENIKEAIRVLKEIFK